MAVGFLAYGVSLTLFVVALRHLGASRSGAYFSTAPFVGAVVSIVFFAEPVSWQLGLASGLMALGVWLHLTEHHAHAHSHNSHSHAHPHVHDAHHMHAHALGEDALEPHDHVHHHEPLTHDHAHYPDAHHRHGH